MTCFEIRALSTLGAKACPGSCPHLSGLPQPLPCEEELSAAIQIRSDVPFMAPGCRRTGLPYPVDHLEMSDRRAR